jgi:O-antigen/teichoic acid export membrane protein
LKYCCMGIIKKLSTFYKLAIVGKSINVLILRMFGVLLFFLTTLFITNSFAAKTVGMYDFSRSLLIFLGTIAVFGMQQSVIYYSGYLASQNNLGYIKTIYLKMVVIVLIIAIIMNLGLYILSTNLLKGWVNIPIDDITKKTFPVIFFYGVTMLNIDAFRAIDKIYLSEVFRNILRYAFFFLATIFLVYAENTDWLIDAFLYNFVFLTFLSTFFLFKNFQARETKEVNKGVHLSYKEVLKRSAPMAISAASFLLMQSLDVFMLARFTEYETVAYYSVAVKLTLLVSIVLSSVNAVIAPQIAEDFASQQMQLLKSKIKRSTRLILLITLPIIILIGLFANIILSFFGEGYQMAYYALIILLGGQIINAFCGSIGVYLNMTGKQKVFQFILVSALGINVILNYILIPLYGMTGAAIATSVSMILWNIVAVIYVYRKDGVQTFFGI